MPSPRLSIPTMKLSLGALFLLYRDADVSAFAPSRRHDRLVRPGALGGGAPGAGGDDAPTTPRVAPVKKKKVLTAADVVAKSKAAGGPGGSGSGDPDAPGAHEAPKIFPPSTYDDFQSSLLLLEKRARGGAGSLSADEVRKFEEETGRIVSEMREYMADPEGCRARIERMHAADAVEVRPGDYFDPEAARPATPETAAATAAAAAVTAPPPPAPAPAVAEAPPEIVTSITSSTTQSISSDSTQSEEKEATVPPSEDDDIPFDESGGFGLARGTTNTYAIPGMDEMNPEEYRAKLQETISARQAQRRKNSLSRNRGIIGNASSQGYLDGLSGGNQGEIVDDSSNSVANNGSGSEGVASEGVASEGVASEGDVVREEIDSEYEEAEEDEDLLDKQQKQQVKENIVEPNTVVQKLEELTSSKAAGELEEELQNQEKARIEVKEARDAKTKEKEMWYAEQNKLVKERLEARKRAEMAGREVDVALGPREEDEEPEQQQQISPQSELDDEAERLAETTEDAEEPVPKWESPFAAFRRNKLEEELSRKSEWHGEVGSKGEGQLKKSGGRFKRNQELMASVDDTSDQPAPDEDHSSETGQEDEEDVLTDQELLQTSLDEKTTSITPASSISEPNMEDWWGNQQARQRPIPDSERQSSFFKVHTLSFGSIDKSFEASRKVSKEATQSFVHGDEANSLRPQSTLRESRAQSVRALNPRGPGDGKGSTSSTTQASQEVSSKSTQSFVHGNEGKSQRPMRMMNEKSPNVRASDHRGPGDTKSPTKDPPSSRSSVGSSVAGGVKKSLVDTEERVRPIPSTDTPEYTKKSDHRGVGDTRNLERYSAAFSSSSLVETEGRVRPTPSTKLPEYAQVANHRSVGDVRDPKTTSLAATAKKSLVETEPRVRPTASTDMPEYAQVQNHRGAGDLRDPKKSGQAYETPISLVQTEGRARPSVKASNVPEYAQVRDRRSVGDMKDPKRRSQLTSPDGSPKSLIEKEGRARPIASSRNYPHGLAKATDHRGPGDENTLTKRAASQLQQSAATVSSQQQSELGPATSLIENEARARPIASSRNHPHGYGIASDHRGPGDNNSLTKQIAAAQGEEESSSVSSQQLSALAPATSLINAEQRARPLRSFGQFEPVQMTDHRGPGDSNALTRRESSKQVPPSARYVPSLSEAEPRVRPTPYSDQNQHDQITDHRGVGDTRTLTSKVGSSSASTFAVPSLSVGEQRQRPVPSFGIGQARVGDHRDPGDTRTLTEKVRSSSASSSTATSLSEGEQRQRPVPPSGRSQIHATSQLSDDESEFEDGHWWDEETQRTRRTTTHSSSSDTGKVLNRGLDRDAQVKGPDKSVSEEPPIPPPPSALKSLLREETKRHLTSNMREAAAAAANAPVAVMPPSLLQSLVKDDPDDEDEESNNPPRQGQRPAAPTSKLSSLLKGDRHKVPPRSKRKGPSPTYETAWWNEKPKRPVGYVKHFQPMNTSYVKKFEAPRDYGNVVTAQTVSDDDDDSERDNDDAAATAAAPQEDGDKEDKE